MTRRWLPWLAPAVAAVAVLVWAGWPEGGPESAPDRTRRIASELRCVECQGLSVADSDTVTSEAIKEDIGRRIEEGQSDAGIRQAYVDRYGEVILMRPEGRGLGLLVWGLPIAVLVGGAGLLGWFLARSRAEPRLEASEADRALVEEARHTAEGDGA
ncbi:MAG: cytochrome c-type biogenesis protein CcmH [Acidimicrobiia bacterium]|nr:cytochrome c-type biogenesis protein CcmH [Acidimicrobiia bacterium]